MKLRKLKRLRQEWAGQCEFLSHGVHHGMHHAKPSVWRLAGWRYFKELSK